MINKKELALKPLNELIFETRAMFREWLQSEGTTSDGVWLIFAKTNVIQRLKKQ